MLCSNWMPTFAAGEPAAHDADGMMTPVAAAGLAVLMVMYSAQPDGQVY